MFGHESYSRRIMCTAVTYQTNHVYFGRTLDYESSYGEEIVILPRKFPLSFLHMGTVTQHYAIMGIAHVTNQYPLFYDAINEKGLCMAGLNFVGNAYYAKSTTGENEVAQYIDINNVIREIPTGFMADALIGKIFIVTGTGKYFKNVKADPENNLGIIRIAEDGTTAQLLWGYKDGGRFTSE